MKISFLSKKLIKEDGTVNSVVQGRGEATAKAVLHRQHSPLPLVHRAQGRGTPLNPIPILQIWFNA